jgi:hypothetical protein
MTRHYLYNSIIVCFIPIMQCKYNHKYYKSIHSDGCDGCDGSFSLFCKKNIKKLQIFVIFYFLFLQRTKTDPSPDIPSHPSLCIDL